MTQVDGWGAHDVTRSRMVTTPEHLGPEILRRWGPHPFTREPVLPLHDPSPRALAGAAERAIAGVRARGELAAWLLEHEQPDVAILTFPEWHHVGHVLWHTVETERPAESPLWLLLEGIDEQIGRLRAAQPDAAMVVAGFHGMRRGNGLPTALPGVLRAAGYAVPRAAGVHAGHRLAGAAKAWAPDRLRAVWRRRAPRAVALRVAESTLLGDLDWARTRAFALPADQHGWVRINLAGREAEGIVPPQDYDRTCDELTELLLGLRTAGAPVVERVLRTTAPGSEPAHGLPDLVVHWSEATLSDPLVLDGLGIAVRPDARRLTGQHSERGFVAASGVPEPDGELDLPELGALLAQAQLGSKTGRS